ncbi:MAG: class II fructose-bisphosphatase, partial [Halobacteriovoraceae bacterium]|nr:class II fructose-bisphosphatase [Halobacteriovoraceae bacterium]
LYIGEKVGTGNGPKLEIALDPLEGTTVCAIGASNSISVMAIANEGGLLHAPDTYMKKIAVGAIGKGIVDINETPTENLRRLAEVKKCRVNDLTACILDRERHADLIAEVREAGARIKLIGDGDVAGALACCGERGEVDILMGTGGAPEGVIAAAALQCMGGDFQGILQPRNEEEIVRAKKMGIDDITKVFSIDELASGDVMFVATGVTTGTFLKGVGFTPWGAFTHSIVMRSASGTIRQIKAEHHFDTKPRY